VIRSYFERTSTATTTTEQGKALEDLICYVMENTPGISIADRNLLSPFGTEELDIVLWNKMLPEGLFFLQSLLIVECKNWSAPVDGHVIEYFAGRLRHTGCNDGILVAANGITGSFKPMSGAHYHVMMALADDRRIMVVTREELEALETAGQFVRLLQRKRLELMTLRTQLL
jgi:hypothetical protein